MEEQQKRRLRCLTEDKETFGLTPSEETELKELQKRYA